MDSELVGPWVSGLQTAVQTDARSAGDAALRHGRFGSDPKLTLRVSEVLGSNLTAGVVDATAGGVCSRALSVSITHADGSAESSLTFEPALSLCNSVDPRPLVVQDIRGSGGPLSVVWVGVPRAGVSVQFSPHGSRDDFQADWNGFLVLQARSVEVLAVSAYRGPPLWAPAFPSTRQ